MGQGKLGKKRIGDGQVRGLAALRDFDPVYVGSGSCVTSIAGPNGSAQLYER